LFAADTDTDGDIDAGSDSNSNSNADDDDDDDAVPALPSSTVAHALEIFERYSSTDDREREVFVSDSTALFHILCSLDIEATQEDASIVFRYLDTDGDGRLMFLDEFLPWYLEAVGAASGFSAGFRNLLVGRRTVEVFDTTPVDDAVLQRAVQCAIAAPNRSESEPWRFRKIGPHTIRKLARLNAEMNGGGDGDGGGDGYTDWETVAPGWCVVTRAVPPTLTTTTTTTKQNQSDDEQDFKSVCCAIQNFMLSMWSEGIGTKWTTGPVQTTDEFAELCGINGNSANGNDDDDDNEQERVVGIIWYGYATGGTKYADPKRRKLAVEDVLGYLP